MPAPNARGRYRVGDAVKVVYGAEQAVARVVEVRGPIAHDGSRLYRVSLFDDPLNPTTFDSREGELVSASSQEVEAAQAGRSIASHQTLTFYGSAEDEYGMPDPWHHYLVVATDGSTPGSGAASIISLTDARKTGVAQSPSEIITVDQGGREEALSEAARKLTSTHAGLRRTLGAIRR